MRDLLDEMKLRIEEKPMEELMAMVKEEEKRLDVGSEDFMERHNDIMQMIEKARQEGKGN